MRAMAAQVSSRFRAKEPDGDPDGSTSVHIARGSGGKRSRYRGPTRLRRAGGSCGHLLRAVAPERRVLYARSSPRMASPASAVALRSVKVRLANEERERKYIYIS